MFPNSLAASNTWHKTPFAILVTLSGWVRCLKLALLIRNLLFACNDRRAIIAVNRRLAENSSNGMLFASTLCKIVFAQLKLESRLKERRATVTFTLMYLSKYSLAVLYYRRKCSQCLTKLAIMCFNENTWVCDRLRQITQSYNKTLWKTITASLEQQTYRQFWVFITGKICWLFLHLDILGVKLPCEGWLGQGFLE